MGDMFDLNNNGRIDIGESYLRNEELKGGSGGSGGNNSSGGCGVTIIMLLVVALCGWLSEQGIDFPFKILCFFVVIVFIIGIFGKN